MLFTLCTQPQGTSRSVLVGTTWCQLLVGVAVCLKVMCAYGASSKLTLQRLAPPHCHHDLHCRHQEAGTCLRLVDQASEASAGAAAPHSSAAASQN